MSEPRTLRELLDELDRWRVRAARGTGRARVPLRDLAAVSGVPRSSLARYLTGATVMPVDVLDAVVQALGADAKQTREWAEAWEGATAGSTRPDRQDSESVRAVWQLPADTGLFTGRTGEVETLLGLAGQATAGDGPGAVVISAIDGMGGVGKTALAVHVGHLLADRFPGGALYLELHTYTVGVAARAAFDVQGAALVALGVAPQAIPADPDARAAAYRHRLAGTRTLIVVDDARDEDQVRTLLPGTEGCLVIVTSRNRLKALDEAEALRLDVLPQEEAEELFRQTAGAGRADPDDPAVPQIVRLCGNLPLAVRIAGALLRARPAWALRHLLDDLSANLAGLKGFDDGQRRLAAVLDMSHRHLPEPARILFRRLGQIPGPDGDAHAAAALLDCDPRTAGRLLGLLADRSILTEHAVGRWRMHDLLREHARTLADTEDAPEERRAAQDRLLHYYGHTAQTASLPIARRPRPAPAGPAPAHAPDLTDPETARAWLRAEHANLDAGHAHARTAGLDRHTIALASGLAEIMVIDGPWARAPEIHLAAVAAAGDADSAARATALNDLGQIRQLTGGYPEAARAQSEALEVFRRIGDRHGEANALNGLARVRHVTGDFAGSAEAQSLALEIYREIGHRLGEAYALNDLGRVQHMTGDHSGAAQAQLQALEIFRQLGNRHGEANALNDLARVWHMTGEYPAADDALRQALELYRRIGHRLGEANALNDLGRIRHMTGDFPGVVDALTRAQRIYRQIGNPDGEANTLNDLGRVRFATEDFPGAADALTRALAIYRRVGNRHGEAAALAELGRACHATGDLAGAAEALTQAIAKFREVGSPDGEACAVNFYAATVAALGDRPRALMLYQQALATHRELHKPDDEAVSLEGIADHHFATGDPAQGFALLNQALAIYQQLGMRPDAERVQARLSEQGAG